MVWCPGIKHYPRPPGEMEEGNSQFLKNLLCARPSSLRISSFYVPAALYGWTSDPILQIRKLSLRPCLGEPLTNY